MSEPRHPDVRAVQEDGTVKALHDMHLYLPAGSVRGRLPRVLGNVKVLTPDNRPTIGEQLRTCGNCRHFRPRRLEEIMHEGVGTFLQKEAGLLPDPDKGHGVPPPGYEMFRPNEAGFCIQFTARFLAQRYGTCDGWQANREALKPWLRNFAAAEALEWERHRQAGLAKKRDAEREAEHAGRLARAKGLVGRAVGALADKISGTEHSGR